LPSIIVSLISFINSLDAIHALQFTSWHIDRVRSTSNWSLNYPDLILKGGVASTETLHFALATITNLSAWLVLGFGLIMLVAGSRRLLIRFAVAGASKQTPVEQSK
jgi:hypothetical protein